jgi:hypothetical protein
MHWKGAFMANLSCSKAGGFWIQVWHLFFFYPFQTREIFHRRHPMVSDLMTASNIA